MSKASFGGSRAQGFPELSEVEAWGFACRGEYIKKDPKFAFKNDRCYRNQSSDGFYISKEKLSFLYGLPKDE